MENSLKSRLILAGIVTAGVSSAALYLLHHRGTRDTYSNAKKTQLTNSEIDLCSTPTSSTSGNRNVPVVDTAPPGKANGNQRVTSNLNRKGVTVVVSSALMKAFILARKAKSAGLNIINWDRLAEADNIVHGFDKDRFFAYGKYRYRSEQDQTTGRTFLLQKCASNMIVRLKDKEKISLRSPSIDSVPPVSEIFPLGVLKKAGVCKDPFFGDEDDNEAGPSSGFISKKSNGKVVRFIPYGTRKNERQKTAFSSVPLDELTHADVVQTYLSPNSPPEVRRVRFGSEFGDLYNRIYNDYHAVVTPNTPVVIYNSHK